jgi:choloylglycine hydrolase
MDFVASTNSSMYVFPSGLQRKGASSGNPLQWTSKYGSMVTTMYDVVTIDGMNSEGLAGSMLYLDSSDYGVRNQSIPGLAIGFWLQYFLDMYPDVASAADAVKKNPSMFQVLTKDLVPGVSSTGHVTITDKTGDNMVMEFLDGKPVIHHGKEFQVTTNDPSYDKQLALNAYWEPISNYSLPGTSSPAGKSQLSHGSASSQ